MGPLKFLSRNGLEGVRRFYGLYRGFVVDNKDPENLNRILVNIPSVNRSLDLWAYPRGYQANFKSGCRALSPPLMSMVWVEFEYGDPGYPVWSEGHWALGEMPEDLQNNLTMGIVTPKQNKFIFNEEENHLKISILNNSEGEKPLEFEIKDGVLTIQGIKINLLDAKIGIPKSDNLSERLNLIERDINQLKTLISSAPAMATPNDGGRAALSSLAPWAGASLVETQIEDIANENILQ